MLHRDDWKLFDGVTSQQYRAESRKSHRKYMFYRCTLHYCIYILFTHQQMHFLLNFEKLKFILKYK